MYWSKICKVMKKRLTYFYPGKLYFKKQRWEKIWWLNRQIFLSPSPRARMEIKLKWEICTRVTNWGLAQEETYIKEEVKTPGDLWKGPGCERGWPSFQGQLAESEEGALDYGRVCSLRRLRPPGCRLGPTTQITRAETQGPHNIQLWKAAGLLAAAGVWSW